MREIQNANTKVVIVRMRMTCVTLEDKTVDEPPRSPTYHDLFTHFTPNSVYIVDQEHMAGTILSY